MAEPDFTEIARISERLNKDPKSKIFVQLADAYRKNDMIEEALEVLKKGLEYHPNYALAYLIQGKCFFDKRIFIQAKDAFEKAIGFDPQNIIALRMLAQTCESLKDETGQITAYKSILAIDPTDETIREKLGKIEASQRKAPLYTISMAEEYERQQNFSQALAIYEYLLATDPTDLVLQERVKALKPKITKKEISIEEEKIEGLQLETYFKPDELDARASDSTARISPVPAPEVVEQHDEPVSEPLIEQEESTAENILPVEDFLTDAPVEETPESTMPSVENKDIEVQEEIKTPEEPVGKTEEKIEIVDTSSVVQEPALTDIVSGKDKSDISVESAPEQESPKPEPTKKPSEEDFQSFQDWLSGLLK